MAEVKIRLEKPEVEEAKEMSAFLKSLDQKDQLKLQGFLAGVLLMRIQA